MISVSAGKKDDAPVLLVDGVRWIVYEHAIVYDRRATVTLLFECPERVRRVRTFPADWRRLSDEALFSTGQSAADASPRVVQQSAKHRLPAPG
jgi:hypothetical protein